MNQIIYDAIGKLVKKEPLFASLVGELEVVKSDSIPTAATDGKRLLYNQEWISKLTLDETAGVVLHETLHCAFKHLWRREKRNPAKWNIAADYAINGVVNESFPLPKGCLLDSKYYGMSAEEIYNSLPDTKMKHQEWGDHSKWPNNSKNKNQGSGKGKGKKEKESWINKIKKVFGQDKGEGEEESSENGDQKPDRNSVRWDELFKNVILKNYGKMPGSLKRIIEKNYYIPVIDWAALVSNILSEDTSDYTFSQPDRRYLEDDFILPDLYTPEGRLKDVVFAYDTSGSISQQQLFSFYMETLNLFNNFSSFEGWVAICDAILYKFKKIDDRNASFRDFGFQGGGGTSFEPVFNRIKREGINPKAVFYFTDTEGSFPHEKPTYPVFWMVMSSVGDGSKPYVPFGQVIKFLPKL